MKLRKLLPIVFFVACVGSSQFSYCQANAASVIDRGLQTDEVTTTYSAQYSGQFQYLHDPFCFGPAPVLRAACTSGTVRVMNTSHPSIQCSSTLQSDSSLNNFIECTNTCTLGSECKTVYENTGVGVQDGPFGEIFFECSGDTLRDAEGIFVIAPSTESARCEDNTNNPRTRNFQVARIAVNCGGQYVVDDFYAECHYEDPALPVGDDGIYTCVEGGSCPNGRSCDRTFTGIITLSDIEHIQEECVIPNVPIVPSPVPPPGTLETTVNFEARWSLLFCTPPLFNGCNVPVFSGCTQNAPKVEITCEDGSSVELLSTTHPTIACNVTGSSVLECTDSGNSFVNQFVGVSYRCVGPVLPDSKVEYLADENSSCDGNPAILDVSHAVQLGISCFDGTGFVSLFRDVFTDCGEIGHDFAKFDGNGQAGNRLTCIEKVPFTGSSGTQTIPSVSIKTDARWQGDPVTGCFEVGPVPPSPGTPTLPPRAPTTSPTKAPVAPSPTRAPTMSPTMSPTIALTTESPTFRPTTLSTTTSPTYVPGVPSTLSPTENPTLVPDVPTSSPTLGPTRSPFAETSPPVGNKVAPVETGDGDGGGGSTIAIIAGAVVGGVAIIAIAAFLSIRVCVRNQGQGPKDGENGIESTTFGGIVGDIFYRNSTSTPPYREPSTRGGAGTGVGDLFYRNSTSTPPYQEPATRGPDTGVGDLFYRHSTSTPPYREGTTTRNLSHFGEPSVPDRPLPPTQPRGQIPDRIPETEMVQTMTRQGSGRSRPSYGWSTDDSLGPRQGSGRTVGTVPRQGSGRTVGSGQSGRSGPPRSSNSSGRSWRAPTRGSGHPDVRFKDQAQTILSAENVAPVPMVEAEAVAEPVAAPVAHSRPPHRHDASANSHNTAGSGQSHHSAHTGGSGQSRRSAEPPGRTPLHLTEL